VNKLVKFNDNQAVLIQQWADLHYGGNFTLAVNKLIEAQLKHNDLKESKND